MLGTPCSPCCCGPELDALPLRFEVDILALDAQEKHWSLRFLKDFGRGTVSRYSTGYVQNWLAGEITSGPYLLELLSLQNGIATYQYLSPGLILRATCTPSNDGRYFVYLVCVPVRTTTYLWGMLSGFGPLSNDLSSIDPRDLWMISNRYSDPPVLPPYGPQPFRTANEMKSDSVTLTETPVSSGSPNGYGSYPIPYIFQQAFHLMTIGTPLGCPAATVTKPTHIDVEIVSAAATFQGNNWPLQIRSNARMYLSNLQQGWRHSGANSPGRQISPEYPLNPTNFYDQTYGPSLGFSLSGVLVQDGLNSYYYWSGPFVRNIDITQVRAVFSGSTQAWG